MYYSLLLCVFPSLFAIVSLAQSVDLFPLSFTDTAFYSLTQVSNAAFPPLLSLVEGSMVEMSLV